MTILGFRPALWPTVFTIPALVVLVLLGTWQTQRLFWKRDLIATIERGIAADAVPLPAGLLDAAAWAYRRVTVRGTFDFSREYHLIAHTERGNFGYHVVVPLRRADGAGWVLVNRGWVPPSHKDPATRAAGQIAGEVTVTGLVRQPWGQGWFVPENDTAKNIWYFGDAAGMLTASGITAAPALFIEADAAPNPGGFPAGGQTRVRLPNNHLAYAVTWYSGAVVLAVIYVLWHRRRDRDAKQSGTE